MLIYSFIKRIIIYIIKIINLIVLLICNLSTKYLKFLPTLNWQSANLPQIYLQVSMMESFVFYLHNSYLCNQIIL